ncbi:MAG: AEC family transporter [Bacteroidales bacterium]|jgi:predicted permease
MHQQVIITQILILSFLAVIGAIAARFRIINQEVKNSIAKLVFNITLPLLIFSSVTKITLNNNILVNSLFVFIGGAVMITLLFASGEINRRILRLKGGSANVHVIHTMFGNVAFLGYPLFSALFPNGEGLFYAVIYHFTQDVFIWTLGVVLFQKGKNMPLKEKLSHLLNPNTIAFAIGLLVVFSGLRLPELIRTPLAGMGQTTIYLAMMYVGAVLYQQPVKGIFSKGSVYLLGVTKMLIIPWIFLAILVVLKNYMGIAFSREATIVLLMQGAMPCMTMIVVLAKRFESDDILATQNFFITSLMSLLTLPLVFESINFFYF